MKGVCYDVHDQRLPARVETSHPRAGWLRLTVFLDDGHTRPLGDYVGALELPAADLLDVLDADAA